MRLRCARRRTIASLAAIVFVLALAPATAVAGGVSAADAQYAPVKPIVKPASSPPTPPTVVTQGSTAGQPTKPLPFTGLSLLAPVGFSVALLGTGFALRRKFSARAPRK
jgi:hypothetical protein